jgi:hypothetical protein
MDEETIKIKYSIEFEKTITFPAGPNDENWILEEQIHNHMQTNHDDFIEGEVRWINKPHIEDRGI